MMRVSFITANYVARESNYALEPFNWGTADRATVEAFHGKNFSEKFNELCQDVKNAGFSNIDLWVAHLNPQVATKSQIDEAAAILKQHGLTVVAYTAGLGRPDMTHEAAVKVYEAAKAIGAPCLGVGLNPTNTRLAYDLGKEYGIKYAIENHPEKNPQEVLARIGDYGEVIGIAQDTGFWGMFDYDAIKATYELKDHLFHMHLKQVHQVGDEWHSCAYDEGVVDIEGVVSALKDLGYSGAVSVEHEPAHEDPTKAVVHSAKLLRGWLGGLAS
jgi:sugar phosphate isomerase/epimerase